jgi:D-beta-D-heptose 7-phosphate kinase/D-beta-D-heptose 1-phosphate adenosyltransferase
MKVAPLDAARARDLIASFPGLLVLVVGDLMLDRFVVGRVSRISPEAPVPVVQFQTEHVRLGGAANVAHNIIALGGRASLVGLVGRDAGAAQLRQELSRAGGDAGGLVEDGSRPTTEKVRIVTERNQQVARVDYEQDGDVSGQLEQELIERIRRFGSGAKALLVSDYLKGAGTRRVIEAAHRAQERRRAARGRSQIPHLTCIRGRDDYYAEPRRGGAPTHRRIRSDEEAHEPLDFRARARARACSLPAANRACGCWTRAAKAPSLDRARGIWTSLAGDTVAATLALALAAGGTMKKRHPGQPRRRPRGGQVRPPR